MNVIVPCFVELHECNCTLFLYDPLYYPAHQINLSHGAMYGSICTFIFKQVFCSAGCSIPILHCCLIRLPYYTYVKIFLTGIRLASREVKVSTKAITCSLPIYDLPQYFEMLASPTSHLGCTVLLAAVALCTGRGLHSGTVGAACSVCLGTLRCLHSQQTALLGSMRGMAPLGVHNYSLDGVLVHTLQVSCDKRRNSCSDMRFL
jgi:hypothetical protein